MNDLQLHAILRVLRRARATSPFHKVFIMRFSRWLPVALGLCAFPAAAQQPTNVTPADCSGAITAGGAPQNAFTGSPALHGFTIVNIDASAGGGEPLCFSITGTAVCGNAGTYPLAAPTATTFANLSSFTTPPGLATNHALSVVATTTGHKWSCSAW